MKVTFRTLDGRVEKDLPGGRWHAPAGPSSEPPERQDPPTAWQKARHLIRALARWHKEGRPVTPKPLRQSRLAVCIGGQDRPPCPYWNTAGNLGFGECQAPGCGCTKFKAWLLTERCTHPEGSKWPA